MASAAAAFAAIFTQAVNLEGVAGGVEMVFATNFLLQFTHLRREELDRHATIGTNHVMVTATIELVFVTGDAVVESHFTRQAALRK